MDDIKIGREKLHNLADSATRKFCCAHHLINRDIIVCICQTTPISGILLFSSKTAFQLPLSTYLSLLIPVIWYNS